MSKPTITRRDLGGVATGAGLLAAASGMIVEAPAQTASKTFMLIHGAWHGGLRPCGAGQSVWTMVVGGATLLPRASIGERAKCP